MSNLSSLSIAWPALLAASLVTSALAQTPLVVDGQLRATVIISSDSNDDEQLAAEELRSHVLKMSGVELPLVNDAEKAEGVKIFMPGPRTGHFRATACPSRRLSPVNSRFHASPPEAGHQVCRTSRPRDGNVP